MEIYPSKRTKVPWVAQIRIRQKSSQRLADHEIEKLVSAENITSVQIDQRTDPDKYKKVVSYQRPAFYGNDLEGMNLEVWHEDHFEKFAKFIRPLLPCGSLSRVLGDGMGAFEREG